MALEIASALQADRGLQVADRGQTVKIVAAKLSNAMGADPTLDRDVRARIESLSREVPEGSAEWDVLYRQYHEELSRRRR